MRESLVQLGGGDELVQGTGFCGTTQQTRCPVHGDALSCRIQIPGPIFWQPSAKVLRVIFCRPAQHMPEGAGDVLFVACGRSGTVSAASRSDRPQEAEHQLGGIPAVTTTPIAELGLGVPRRRAQA